MGSPKARLRLRLVAVNLLLTLALLSGVELVCRYREQPELERRKLPPKGASELRVFAFGGSTVYGAPVPQFGFVSQMLYWLRRIYPDRDIRIYNFGMPGVATNYVLQQVTRRLADQPDLIIVVTGHNEFIGGGGQSTQKHGWLVRLGETLSQDSAAVRLLNRVFSRIRSSRGVYVMPCQVVPLDWRSASFAMQLTAFENDLTLVVQRVQQRGVKLF